MLRLVRVGEGHQGNNFDAIRLAMALLVVWSHSFAIHLGSEESEWVSIVLNGAYNAGNIGVMAFFVISGFLITQSFERSRTIGSYTEKRVRRIYPGYLVAISICAFVVVPLFSTHASITPTEVLRTYAYNLVLSGHFPPSDAFAHNPFPSAVNGSLWSIPFEFWCYIGVAVLGVVSLATNKRVLLGLTVGVMTARVLCDLAGVKPYLGPVSVVIGWPYIWLKILPSFLLGMVAYAFQAQLPRSRGLMAVLTGAAIAACWLNGHVADMIVAPALAYVIFYVGFSDRLRLHNAARFGDFSYGTYLYAFPIQQMLQSTKQLTLPEFIGASMILSLLAGVLSWHLVEKHFMSRRRKMQPQLAPA